MADLTPAAPLLELRGIAKRYGGVRALEEVDFACRPGSIHAVLGENGAGKSTLIKIISGVVQPDVGEIRWPASRSASPGRAPPTGRASSRSSRSCRWSRPQRRGQYLPVDPPRRSA